MKAGITSRCRRHRVALLGCAFAVILYLSAYAFLTTWISPSVPGIVDGRGRTVFLFFMPVRELVRRAHEEDVEIWESISPHPLERPCFYVFFPLLLLERECGWRLYDDFVGYHEEGAFIRH